MTSRGGDLQPTRDTGHVKAHGLDTWVDLRLVTQLLGPECSDGGRTSVRELADRTTSALSWTCSPWTERYPKFQRTFEAGLNRLKSLMEIYLWQSKQGLCFVAIRSSSQLESEHQGVTNLGVRVWRSSDWHVHDQLPSD